MKYPMPALKLMSAAFLAAAVLSVRGEGAKDWFRDAQYGLFVHWGCYAVPAKGEWYLNHSQMDPKEYRAFSEQFKAEKYDPREWAKMAKRWGMRYVVFTTRHHDGYSMWESQVNPWNSAKVGPQRDLLKELVPAFREEGIKIGYYYSPANWSNPDYAGYRVRGWPTSKNWKSEEARKRFVVYYQAEFLELIEKYGVPDYVWWDGCLPGGLEGDAFIASLRKRYPKLVTTNRFGKPYDVMCCEQVISRPKDGGLWESCMTLNGSWGYTASDNRWKAPSTVLDMLLECQAGGGNLLLNVGPKADGTIPAESVKILDEVGKTLSRPGLREALRVYSDAVAYEGDARMLGRLFERAERGETIRIVAMGGSITEGAHAASFEGQWGSVFAAAWRELFPKAKIEYRNAGIGATGSEIGAFRYARDVAPFKPDLVAFEFSVNDANNEAAQAAMEGLLRHAARDGASTMLLGMMKSDGTNAQERHLAAARKYAAPYVSYRDAMWPLIKSGKRKLSELSKDGLHPNPLGHAIAGELMGLFVRDSYRKFRQSRNWRPPVPDPVIHIPYENGRMTEFSKLKLEANEGFVPYRESRWGTGLEAKEAGAKVSFVFEGADAAFLYRRGKFPLGKVKVTVDGEELKERPDGYSPNWWWHTPMCWICRGKPGKHTVTIETTGEKSPASEGCGFRLAALLVN